MANALDQITDKTKLDDDTKAMITKLISVEKN